MKLTPRYRITVDILEEYAHKLEAIMETESLSQSDAIRRAIGEYYDHHVKGENHDETPTPESGDSPRGGGF